MGPLSASTSLAAARLVAEIVAQWGIAGICWCGFGLYEWWLFRRWGRVPRILSATREGLTLSRLGWWRMRERHWPATQINGIEFRQVKGNLNWRRTVADLYIRRHKGQRLHFRLSSPDKDLPRKIASRMADVLERPLVRANLRQ
jgi:hypothetical protein